MNILFLRIPCQFVDLTIGKSLQSISLLNNWKYECIDIWDYEFDELNYSSERVIIFLFYSTFLNKNSVLKLKQKLPNSYIFMIESDTIYDDWKSKDYSYIDCLICTSFDIYNEYSGHKALFDWNISEYLINFALRHKYKFPVNKKYDFICLCHLEEKYVDRHKLFTELSKHCSILTNLEENNLINIFKYYMQAKITLGTSTSVLNNDIRSTKAFRDWLGVCVNIPLIYDDKPEIIYFCDNIVPIYRYGNVSDIITIYDKFHNEKGFYQETIRSQQAYILKNSVDKQLQQLIKEVI